MTCEQLIKIRCSDAGEPTISSFSTDLGFVAGWLAGWLADWLPACWLAGWLTVGWQLGCLTAWLTVWLAAERGGCHVG